MSAACGLGRASVWASGGARSGRGRGSKKEIKWGAGGAREERTQNMYSMVVTLDVSKLSGWLNADAPCPAKNEGIRCRRHAGWEERACGPMAVQGACGRGSKNEQGGRGKSGVVQKTCTPCW